MMRSKSKSKEDTYVHFAGGERLELRTDDEGMEEWLIEDAKRRYAKGKIGEEKLDEELDRAFDHDFNDADYRRRAVGMLNVDTHDSRLREWYTPNRAAITATVPMVVSVFAGVYFGQPALGIACAVLIMLPFWLYSVYVDMMEARL